MPLERKHVVLYGPKEIVEDGVRIRNKVLQPCGCWEAEVWRAPMVYVLGRQATSSSPEIPGEFKPGTQFQWCRKRVAKAIRDNTKKRGRGSIPGGWERWAEQTLKPPKVRWQDKLGQMARSAFAYRPGSVDWTYKKMSRRQSGIGYGKGRPILHSMHSPIPRVDVWVDTSGSMSENELSTAIREVRGVLLTKAIVHFGAIDADVQVSKVIQDWRELPRLLKGGGGTDFRPAFEASAKRRDRSDVLIFITDGMGPAPDMPPPHARVIWLLVGPSRQRPCSWGDVIEIDNDDEKKEAV